MTSEKSDAQPQARENFCFFHPNVQLRYPKRYCGRREPILLFGECPHCEDEFQSRFQSVSLNNASSPKASIVYQHAASATFPDFRTIHRGSESATMTSEKSDAQPQEIATFCFFHPNIQLRYPKRDCGRRDSILLFGECPRCEADFQSRLQSVNLNNFSSPNAPTVYQHAAMATFPVSKNERFSSTPQAAVASPPQSQMLKTVVVDTINHLHTASTAERTAEALVELVQSMCRGERNSIEIAAAGGIEYVLGAMRQHSNHTGIQELSCVALWKLACNNDENQKKMHRAGGIECILNALRQHSNNSSIQGYGCLALNSLAYDDANKESIAAIGGIKCILDAMRQHFGHVGIQESGCKALANLASNDNNKELISKAGGIQCILNAMLQHSSHAGIQEQACVALGPLLCNIEVQSATAKAIQSIVDAMRKFSNNVGIQEKGCRALSLIGASNNDSQESIAAAGGIECIVKAMRQHLNVSDIQESGCMALTELALVTGKKEKIAALNDGIERILNAMKEYPDHSNIQEKGCAALANLAYKNNEHQKKIAALGGIGWIVHTMKQHCIHPGIQEKGCMALSDLAFHGTEMQETGMAALWNLTLTSGSEVSNNDNPVIIAAGGGICCILDAMKLHFNHAGIQLQGCWALYNLSFASTNQSILEAVGAIQIVQRAQRNFREDAQLKTASTQVLKRLNAS